MEDFGGPGEIRTHDLFHAMEARSQLRHRPISVGLRSFYHAAALRRALRGALDDTFSGPARARRHSAFDRGLDIAPDEGTLDVAPAPEFDVPQAFAVAFEHPIRIGQRGAARESQVDVPRIRRDVAEHVFHLAAEAEPDGHGVELIDRFGCVRYFFEDDFAEGKREVGDVRVVSLEESEELRVGRTGHGLNIH